MAKTMKKIEKTTHAMRAKMRITGIGTYPSEGDGPVTSERLQLCGVSKSGAYPSDGSDEDNTFAKFSPSVSLDIMISNPALIGKFKTGDTFYVDFEKIEPQDKPEVAQE